MALRVSTFKLMRIVHVTGYYPPHVGGMEYRTKNLAENIAKRGYGVEVITSDIGCHKNKIPSTDKLIVRYLKSFETAHTPIMPSLPLRLMLLPRDSVIHLHISQAILSEVTFLICKLRGLGYLAHIHLDVDASGPMGFLLPFYKKYFLSRVIKGADAITVLTDYYKKLISEKYDIKKSKITVIPNGTYFKAAKNRKKTLHSPIRLLFVGRLSVQKNVPLLLKAFSICIYQYKMNILLRIAGDGEKREEIENLIKKLKLSRYVFMLGSVSPAQVQKLYNTSDVFILSSNSESFGTVVIEAMATGTPVVATDIPAMRNIIKHKVNGVLVKQNSDDMARVIYNLCKDSSLRERIVKNALIEVKRYNWETVTNKYEKVYRNIFLSKKR